MSEQVGQVFGWNWVANDGEVDLHVQATILDITGGSVTPVSKVAMFHTAFGSYAGVFTPTQKNRVYHIISVVFLDALFVNPDPDRPRGSLTFDTIDFATGVAPIDLILPIKAVLMDTNKITAVVQDVQIQTQIQTETIQVKAVVEVSE